MNLEHKGGQKWRVRISLGKDPSTGKYRVESRTFEARTKTEAKRRGNEIEVELRAAARSSRVTFGLLIDRFLDEHEIERSTRASYEGLARNHIKPALGNVAVGELTPGHFHQLYRDLTAAGLSASSVNQASAVCRGACAHGRVLGWIEANPAAGVRRPKMRRQQVELPPLEDTVLLFAHVATERPEMAALLWVAASTGARRGELAGLQWRDLEGGVLAVHRTVDRWGTVQSRTKTSRDRRFPLDQATLGVLAAHKERQAAEWGHVMDHWFVFPSPLGPGLPRNIDSLTRYVQRVRDRLGIESAVTLKSLRHLAASALVAGGTDPVTAAARLGHDPSVLMRVYAHPMRDPEREAAETVGKAVSALFAPKGLLEHQQG